MITKFAILLLPFAGIAFALIYAKFRPIVCSVCKATLSPIANNSRRSLRQWLNGGFDCPSCNSKLDVDCNAVTEYPPANFRYLAMVIGIPVATLLLLLFMRFHETDAGPEIKRTSPSNSLVKPGDGG